MRGSERSCGRKRGSVAEEKQREATFAEVRELLQEETTKVRLLLTAEERERLRSLPGTMSEKVTFAILRYLRDPTAHYPGFSGRLDTGKTLEIDVPKRIARILEDEWCEVPEQCVRCWLGSISPSYWRERGSADEKG